MLLLALALFYFSYRPQKHWLNTHSIDERTKLKKKKVSRAALYLLFTTTYSKMLHIFQLSDSASLIQTRRSVNNSRRQLRSWGCALILTSCSRICSLLFVCTCSSDWRFFLKLTKHNSVSLKKCFNGSDQHHHSNWCLSEISKCLLC